MFDNITTYLEGSYRAIFMLLSFISAVLVVGCAYYRRSRRLALLSLGLFAVSIALFFLGSITTVVHRGWENEELR